MVAAVNFLRGGKFVLTSDYENHGVVFSQNMAIDSHEYNKFSASTTNMGSTF